MNGYDSLCLTVILVMMTSKVINSQMAQIAQTGYQLLTNPQALLDGIKLCNKIAYIEDFQTDTTNEPFRQVYNYLLANNYQQVWLAVVNQNGQWSYSMMIISGTYDIDRQQTINLTVNTNINNLVVQMAPIKLPTVCAPANASVTKCATGQIMHNSHCYWMASSKTSNYSTAEVNCAASKGLLAPAKDKGTHAILALLQYAQSSTSSAGDMWIGMSMQTKWTWSDGSAFDKQSDYNGFPTAKQYSDGANGQTCVQIASSEGYQWIENTCSTNLSGVCVQYDFTCPVANAYYYKGSCYSQIVNYACPANSQWVTIYTKDATFAFAAAITPKCTTAQGNCGERALCISSSDLFV